MTADVATPALASIALVFAGVAAWCARRAFGAPAAPAKLAWAGRAAALAGAAFALWFPAELYGELVVVARTGGDDVSWLPRAIGDSFAMLPLTVVPALVSLRSVRLAAVLFAVTLVHSVFDELVRPLGVIFPDASHDASAYVFSYGPLIVTTLLLAFGRDGPAFGRGLSGKYLTLGPATQDLRLWDERAR